MISNNTVYFYNRLLHSLQRKHPRHISVYIGTVATTINIHNRMPDMKIKILDIYCYNVRIRRLEKEEVWMQNGTLVYTIKQRGMKCFSDRR
jgi:hypothetical protein